MVSQSNLISQSNLVSQSVKVKQSVKLWYLILISCQAISLSLILISVLRSDCIELDFKEIFHLVISIYYLCFWDQLSISMFKYWSKTDLIYDADIRQGCSLVIAQFVWKWNPWIQSLTISRITNISNTNKDYIRLANRCITLNTWWGNVILNISIAL